MADFGTLKTEIAGEIDRTDVDTYIGTAIQTALRKHQENKVWFNQDIDTSQATSASSEDLALPSDYFAIDSIRIIYATNDEALLTIRGWTELQELFPNNGSTSRPTDCAIFDGVIKLRPIPDATYTTKISYYKKDTIPSSSGDTHLWMTNASNLIKWEAKAFLYADVLEDEQRSVTFSQKATDELARIKGVFTTQTQSNRLAYN